MSTSPITFEGVLPHATDTSAPAANASRRTARKAPQLLADEIRAEELISGAPSRNGGRLLTEDRDPWTHNAWDRVEWDEELEKFAVEAVERQRKTPVPQELQDKFNSDPAAQWDQFYAHNKDNFFKERAWLQNEFPELAAVLQPDAGAKRVVEIGCGNGSTLFPLLAANENPHLRIHGFDYSKEAVSVVRGSNSFNPEFLTCDVWDLSSPSGLPPTVQPGTIDIVTMIFVLSALHPNEWAQAVRNVHSMLKPGGILLFRDYGRNDLAQLRFKAGRYMQDGLYARGDNTRVYFFERDELVHLFGSVRPSTTTSSTQPPSIDDVTTTTTTTTTATATPSESTTPLQEEAGESIPLETPVKLDTESITTATTTLNESSITPIPATTSSSSTTTAPKKPISPLVPEAQLDLLQLGIDRRMILNRKRQLKMMRVWLQGRWRKPEEETSIESKE